MDNRRWVLTGSSQTSQQKPESSSGGNRILEIWREDRNQPDLERWARTGAPVRDGADSRGDKLSDFPPSPHICAKCFQVSTEHLGLSNFL